MRRLVIITLALTAVLAASSPASATKLRPYRGETSAGTRIAFLVRTSDDGRMSLKAMRFRVEMVCEDTTTIEFDSSWIFGGIGVRFEGRRLTLDITFHSEALHISGVFRPQTADGTFKNTQAALTDTEQAQLCTTGDLTWSANRVASDRGSRLVGSRNSDVQHRMSMETIKRLTHIA